MRWKICCLALLLANLYAAEVDSRAKQIEAKRETKASQLSPEESSRLSHILLWIREDKILERFATGVAGFRLKPGGLVSGSGFAMGPEYLRRDLAGGHDIGSPRQYEIRWFRFDDQTNRLTRLSEPNGAVLLRAQDPRQKVMAYLRAAAGNPRSSGSTGPGSHGPHKHAAIE